MKKILWLGICISLFLSCDPCRNKNCENGNCIEGECECYAGWTGDECEIDICASSCINGQCIDGNCECLAGWTGENCEIDSCDYIACVHGECYAGRCNCDEGWTGVNCNYELCGSGSCVHGHCVNDECVCDEGWTGEFCTENYNPCEGINCLHGTCINGICYCDPNWEGTLCDEIIDLCYQVDCGAHGSCDELTGECECDEGWTGDDCSIPEGTELCTNTCSWHDDGECDDGGPGSDYAVCDCGTDCNDCGPRTETECDGSNDATIAVWTSMVTFPCNTQRIDVYIDGSFEGYLDSYFTSQPDCGDAGTVTVQLNAGSHEVYAECNDGDTYWGPGTVTINSGYCFLLELTEKKALSLKLSKNMKN